MTGLSVLVVLLVAGGCEARSTIEAAQTAVAVGQTTLPGFQTALPGLQATAQAGTTMVTGGLANSSAIALQVQALLAGASVSVATIPPGPVRNDDVTRVDVSASDELDSFATLDVRARQASAGATLLLVGQYYPNATLALTVTNRSGVILAAGTKAPSQTPLLQSPQ